MGFMVVDIVIVVFIVFSLLFDLVIYCTTNNLMKLVTNIILEM